MDSVPVVVVVCVCPESSLTVAARTGTGECMGRKKRVREEGSEDDAWLYGEEPLPDMSKKPRAPRNEAQGPRLQSRNTIIAAVDPPLRVGSPPEASTAVCMHTTDVTVIATTDNCHRYRHHRNKAALQVCVLWRRVCLNAPTSAHACVSVRSPRRARLRSSVCDDWLTQVGGIAL